MKRSNRIGFYSSVSPFEKLTASGCDETETIYYEPGFIIGENTAVIHTYLMHIAPLFNNRLPQYNVFIHIKEDNTEFILVHIQLVYQIHSSIHLADLPTSSFSQQSLLKNIHYPYQQKGTNKLISTYYYYLPPAFLNL